MRNAIFSALLIFLSAAAMAQTPPLVIDENPKLNSEESAWLNENFRKEGFDFTDKYVGFVEVWSGGFYGIGKSTHLNSKKKLFREAIDKNVYRLFVLDSQEKSSTNGFDALLVFTNRGHKGKLERIDRNSLVSETWNTYPQIPSDAGKDTGATLSPANAVFFNELYRASGRAEPSFDFTNKKVAILNTHQVEAGRAARIGISEYVEKKRSQLDQYARCFTDFTYYLDEEQKAASGGYDVIVQLQILKDWPLSKLIAQVK